MTAIETFKIEVKVDPRSTRNPHVEYAGKRKDRLRVAIKMAIENNKLQGIAAQLDAVAMVVKEDREQTHQSQVSRVEIRIEASSLGWKHFFGHSYEPIGT